MAIRQDRRTFGRRETNVLAWIRVDGRPKLCCSIRNVTVMGAFLELTPPGWLPFKFVIEMENDGRLLGCEIRHTRPNGIGIQFVAVEDVAEYGVKSCDSRTQFEEWHGSRRQISRPPSAVAKGQSSGQSLVSRVRALISTKR